MRGAQKSRIVQPRFASGSTVAAIACGPARAVYGSAEIALVPAILEPFPHVADGIVDTECIREKATDGRRADPEAVAAGQISTPWCVGRQAVAVSACIDTHYTRPDFHHDTDPRRLSQYSGSTAVRPFILTILQGDA